MTIVGSRGGGGEGCAKIDMVGVTAQMKSTQFTGGTQKRLPGKGRYRQFNGHELGKTPGDGEGQGSPCCRPWDQIGRHDLATAQQPRSRDTT